MWHYKSHIVTTSFDVITFNNFGEAVAHDVYVFHAQKVELYVLVERLVFVSFACSSVGHGVDLKFNLFNFNNL